MPSTKRVRRINLSKRAFRTNLSGLTPYGNKNLFLWTGTLIFEVMLKAKAYRWFYFYFFYQVKPGMLLLKHS